MKTSEIEQLELMAMGDVAHYLGISSPTAFRLVQKYEIPFAMTSGGRIFLKKDIVAFQLSRTERLKFRKNKVRKLTNGKSIS